MRRLQLLVLALAASHSLWSCRCMVMTLQNKSNFSVTVTPIGASIQKLLVPDCKDSSRQIDVVLGYEEVAGYSLFPHPSFGATVGRVANRISGAQFTLDGATHKLEANDGKHTLHGGTVRWSRLVWSASVSADKLTATFMRTSKDGESGFPGSVRVMVRYSIPEQGTHLNVTMRAMTDKATPLNILNHAYFNLKGATSDSSVLDYVVNIPSNFYTPAVPGQLLPTGQVFRVRGTPYDFANGRKLGDRLLAADGGPHKGYDANYLVPQGAAEQQPVWWRRERTPGGC
ncbi:galactose mutarotase-like domain-containing protein [Scenedesmus sp. NREL 46B-D3]|nr:galactose mutarotase-like domain-containing protein [Scenedesmus sp. NREL 46B-D3]